MKFNEMIIKKIGYIFQKYNLRIIEQMDDYISLESNYISIIIAHNQVEKSNIIWLGKKNNLTEIDNSVLLLFFKSNLELSDVPVNIFINNLIVFFENEAKPLLNGDTTIINELEEFDLRRSNEYTKKLLNQQYLYIIDKAWERKDYETFLDYIDKLDINNLKKSYRLKYEIAKKKIEIL